MASAWGGLPVWMLGVPFILFVPLAAVAIAVLRLPGPGIRPPARAERLIGV